MKLAENTKNLTKSWGDNAPGLTEAKKIADQRKRILQNKARSAAFFKKLDERKRVNDVTDSIYKHSIIADELRAKKAIGKSLKKIGMIGAGIAGTAALAVGGKKLYDKYKNKDIKEQKEFARRDYAGLGEDAQEYLRGMRDVLASKSRRHRKYHSTPIEEILKDNKDELRFANINAREIDSAMKSGVPGAHYTKENLMKDVEDYKRAEARRLARNQRPVGEIVEEYRKTQKNKPKNLPMETQKIGKEKASKLRDMFNRAKDSIKNSKVGKNAAEFYAKHEKGVKIGGGVAAGTALAAGLAVGAKKLADKKKEQQKEFARADYEGLNFIETFKKNYKRNRVAQELKKQRNQINKELEENLKYNASRAKKIANLKRTKALGSIRLGETMENLANLAGSPAEAFKKKPMSNLKKAGYAGLGMAGAAGLAYGGKKLYDKYKKNNESDSKD